MTEGAGRDTILTGADAPGQAARRPADVPADRLAPWLAKGLAAHVGDTPLLPLRTLTRETGIPVYAKAEWWNPGGSVKDRAARQILAEAVAAGALGPAAPGRRLLDATSGNTGIAYATLAPAYGVKVTLTLPENASTERKQILRALGVELILTDPLEGTDGAQEEAARLAAEHPDRYHYVDQYANPANPRAHYTTTGPEIVRQTADRVTHFVAGLGTTGTIVGTGAYLRDHVAGVRIVGVEPDAPFHGLEGLKHLETAHVPEVWDPAVVHGRLGVATEAGQAMVRRLAREEGLLTGPSGGAAAEAARIVAHEAAEAHGETRGPIDNDAVVAALDDPASLPDGLPVVVTLLPDRADKYLSHPFWDEEDPDPDPTGKEANA